MSFENHSSAKLGVLATPPKFVMLAQAGIHPSFRNTAASPICTTATRHRPGWIPAFAGMTDGGLPSHSRAPQTADATTSVMPAKAGIHPSIRNVKAVPIGMTTQYVWPGWIPARHGGAMLRMDAGMTERGDCEVSVGPAIDLACRAQMPTSAPANRVP